MTLPWFCDKHRLWNVLDCGFCDEEMEALDRLDVADVIRTQPVRRPGMDLRPKDLS